MIFTTLASISYSKPHQALINHRRHEELFNAHPHQPIVSINHALKTNPFQRSSIRAHLARLPIARRPTAPRGNIPLHWALHHGTVVHTHTGTNCSTLEARRVKIVISPSFVVDFSGNFCSSRLRRRGSGG